MRKVFNFISGVGSKHASQGGELPQEPETGPGHEELATPGSVRVAQVALVGVGQGWVWGGVGLAMGLGLVYAMFLSFFVVFPLAR